tara:strand:+ start:377 stop:517 length:141 start_codon:yes stop_codon:yes gene_type:complete
MVTQEVPQGDQVPEEQTQELAAVEDMVVVLTQADPVLLFYHIQEAK